MNQKKNEVATVQPGAIEPAKKASILAKMAEKFSVDPNTLHRTLADTVFKGATNEQTVALLIVADQYGLNPFTREIYAFPAKGGGIVPVVGIDGWLRIINSDPQFDGMEFEQDDDSCTCKIYRKDRTHPIIVTEYLDECRRNTDPWNTCPKRMLRHKAIMQCARVAFGFSGIHDEDEGRIIADAEVVSTQPLGKPAVEMPISRKAKAVETTGPTLAEQLFIRAEELGWEPGTATQLATELGCDDLNKLTTEHFQTIMAALEKVPE